MRCVRKVTSALMLGRCGRRVALVVVLCRVQFGVRSPVDAVEPLAAGAPKYIAITPFRLADTRPSEGAYGFTVVNSNTIRINVTGRPGVPSNASAAVVNIALINANGGGYITAYPSGTKLPTTANVNSDAAGRTISDLAHVKIGAGGSIDVTRVVGADVAIDLVAVYVPVTGAVAGGRVKTIEGGAVRGLDTRLTGPALAARAVRSVDLSKSGVPAGAMAAVVNIAAVCV